MTSYRALSRSSWLELVRDPMATGLSMLFPLSFVAMFLVLPDLQIDDGTTVSALEFGLPAVLLFATISLGLSGTAAPMSQQRKDGLLRSLGMTPISRTTYLLAQVPSRALIEVLELLLIGTLALATGSLDLSSWPLLLWSLLLCIGCTVSLGLLAGSVSANPGLVGAISGLIAPVLLFLCGVFLPFRMFPPAVEYVGMALPFTYLGDMLRHSLVGLPLEYPVALGSAVCLAWIAGMVLVTTRVFRWAKD